MVAGQEASRVLLLESLVGTFVPDSPLVLGIDETLKRRRGKKIRAKGIYCDMRCAPAAITGNNAANCFFYESGSTPRVLAKKPMATLCGAVRVVRSGVAASRVRGG
jgi:hypothetical protein